MKDANTPHDRRLKGPSEELTKLLEELEVKRSLLAELQGQIDDAKVVLAQGYGHHLVEVNERLVITALKNQVDAEVAAEELSVVSRLSELDVLTQLPNRALLHERFVQAIANAKRHHTRLALLFIDLDKFKSINDTLGHAAGDMVLKQAARCLVASVRDVDTVSRYGGDEFVILLTDVVQRSDAVLVSHKVAAAIEVPIHLGGHELNLSASIGICIYPEDGQEPDELITCADAAMYRAKRLKFGETRPADLT